MKHAKKLVTRIVQFTLALLLVGVVVVLLARQGTNAGALKDGYPAPEGTQAGFEDPLIPTPDATTICGRSLPTEKAGAKDGFWNYMAARETPQADALAAKPVGASPTPYAAINNVARRVTADGEIIDMHMSPLNKMGYLIENNWRLETADKVIQVYVGALDDTNGPEPHNVDQGAVVVTVWALDYHQAFPELGGQYLTPEKVGPVRIVDEANQVLTLAATDGSVFTFDVQSRQPIQRSPRSPYTRTVGDGTLVEAPQTPYANQGEQIVNQWSETIDGQLITVLAGAETADLWQGVVRVVVADANDAEKIVSEDTYTTPASAGQAHIIDATGQQLVLGTLDGFKLVFDVATRQFITY